MDLIWIVLFLGMYYLKPQEWFAVFASIKFAQIVMIGAVVSLFFRERSVRLNNIIRTPHDWMILAFWGWLIISGPSWWSNFRDTYSLIATYFIIVQTLSNVDRIARFLGWWTFLIVFVAGLAVLSQYGIDPLGSYDLTMGRMKGRLALNLSMFNNPNALGHAVVPAIPMLYFYCIWRRPLFMKEVGYFCLFLPCYCIYLTVSKGSFLTGAAAVMATLTFGRPKTVQIAIIVSAVLFGGTMLWALPRMQELKRAKTDEAIMGRVAAFTHGLKIVEGNYRGVGYRQWLKDFIAHHHFSKAAHSSYVQIGAELGSVGFALFLGVLYCNLRTLVTARTQSTEEERIRRVLFVLVITYMVSSWMVDLGYRTTYFMFTAATAAFHRHLLRLNEVSEEEEKEESSGALVPAIPAWRARFVPQPEIEAAFASSGSPTSVATLEAEPAAAIAVKEEEEEVRPRIAFNWNRLGFIDIGLVIFLATFAIRFWRIALARMSQ